MNKRKILIILAILLALIGAYKLIYFNAYRMYANHCIDLYMEKQGLSYERILSDTGTKYEWKRPWFYREIVLAKYPNAKLTYNKIYDKQALRWYKDYKNPHESQYYGIFYMNLADNNLEGNQVQGKDGNWISKGELDKTGKIILPFD